MFYDDGVLVQTVVKAVVAGLLASVACGLGVLPLLIKKLDPKKHTGIGYGVAGGLMFSASVYNLILPGLHMGQAKFAWCAVVPIIGGILLGAMFLSVTDRYLSKQQFSVGMLKGWGGKSGVLIFLAMAVHSIPEGVAVGVGFASGEIQGTALGSSIAVAIAIHNIPEGLAVAIPLRAGGASIGRCFTAAFLTSLPQPIAAIPAVILASLFEPVMSILMGFAAGAMIFLVLLELIPHALNIGGARQVAWAFTAGFCLMLLIQIMLQ